MSDTNNTQTTNAVVLLADDSGLPVEKIALLRTKFASFYEQAKEWEHKAAAIEITDESQVALMQDARVARLALRNIRTTADRIRKELKAEADKEGKVIQDIWNAIKNLIEPIEAHLEHQETFKERAEANRRQEKINLRRQQLSEFCDPSLYNLGDFSDEGFERVLEDQKIMFERRQEEERIKNLNDYRMGDLSQFGKPGEAYPTDPLEPLWYGKMSDDEYSKIYDSAKTIYEKKQNDVVVERLTNARCIELLRYRVSFPNNMVPGEKQGVDGEIPLGELSDQNYNNMLAAAKRVFDYEEQKRLDEQKEHRISTRKLQLTEMGFVYDGVTESYLYPSDPEVYCPTNTEIENSNSMMWDSMMQQNKLWIGASKKQKEKAAQKLAKAPDREKIKVWLQKFEAPLFGDASVSDESIEVVKTIIDKFNAFKNWAMGEIEKL